MKVLLFCLAFAAVALAMPVAEEKPDVGAPPPPVAAAKSEVVVNNQPAPVDEKKAEAVSELKEPATQPEAKSAPVEEPVINPEVPEKASVVKSEEVVPASQSAEPEPEKNKPEPNEASESKTEEKAAEPEAKLAEEPKATEVPALVNEVPKDASAKSAALPVESIDIVDAVKNAAKFADDVIMPDGIISIPEKKIDLLEVPVAAVESKPKTPESAAAEEPAKSEVSKADEPKVDVNSKEPGSDATPDAPKPQEIPALEDSLRVVRNTVDGKLVVPVDMPEPTGVSKSESIEESKSESDVKEPAAESQSEAAAGVKPGVTVTEIQPEPAVAKNTEPAVATNTEPAAESKAVLAEEPKPEAQPAEITKEAGSPKEVQKDEAEEKESKSSEAAAAPAHIVEPIKAEPVPATADEVSKVEKKEPKNIDAAAPAKPEEKEKPQGDGATNDSSSEESKESGEPKELSEEKNSSSS